MKLRLKDWPLSRQILILFMLLTILLGGSVGVLYPLAVKQYLVTNTYSLLEEEFEALSGHISFTEHNELLPFPASAPFFLQLLLSKYEYSFDIIVFGPNGQQLGIRSSEQIPRDDVNELFRMAASYRGSDLQHGTLERRQESYLFVSKQLNYHDFPYYLVLFSKEREINRINAVLTRQFFYVFAIILMMSWLLAMWFSRYLSGPIRRLDESCQKIARRQFDVPLKLDRQDEIGQLARSFDKMKNQLREYDESQRHFIQNISHELKTPIMAIQGYTEGLKEGVFQGEQADKGLAIIMEESKRLEKVVEQLLYLTKIESVAQMTQFKRVDINELFALLQERLTVLNPSIEWDVKLPPSLHCLGDGEQLSTAFVNILENQLRYAKSKLTIRGMTSTDKLTITLANDGPPIEEALLPQLFQRFRKGKSGKHGLGLAIARAVIESHVGTIQVENTADGVCFTVVLPIGTRIES
ncbi:MAG: sensor histidine kinase [Clostridia bacterium]